MSEYPKIETLYDRDPKTFAVTKELRLPEFGLVKEWLVTEKIDGTNVRIDFTVDPEGAAGVRFKGRTDNAQMPTFLLTTLTDLFTPEKVAAAFTGPTSGTLYGEGYGPKIQSGGYYRDDAGFRLFDVRVGDWWLNWPDVGDVAHKLGVGTVPVLGFRSLDDAVGLVGGDSSVARAESGEVHEAEGVVARTDPLLLTRSGHRLMWKLKGKDFRGNSR